MTNDLVKNNKGIIEGYTIDELKKTLTIKYLDKTEVVIKNYTKSDVKKVEKDMIDQALYIVKKYFKESKKRESSRSRIMLIVYFLTIGLIQAYNYANKESITTVHQAIEIILGCLPAALGLMFLDDMDRRDERLADKYKMYLDNMEYINKNLSNDALYEGIEEAKKKGLIGINTIDKYTYEEMRRLNQNIVRIRLNS